MMLALPRRLWAARWAYLFLLPAMIPFALFILWPMFEGLRLSFYDAQLVSRKWIGLGNFFALAQDHAFRKAVLNTIYFVLGVVPLTVAISLFLAVIVSPLRLMVQSFFRMAFYLPVVAAGVVLSIVWLYIYNPTYGLLNYLLTVFNLPPVQWLGTTETALPSLAMVVVSWTIGQPLIIFLAGLAGIPQDLYDAASIDGAGAWNKFWYVTMPLMRPIVLVAVWSAHRKDSFDACRYIINYLKESAPFWKCEVTTAGKKHWVEKNSEDPGVGKRVTRKSA